MRPLLVLLAAGCSTIQTVRLQEENVEVGAGLRPVAGIQASVSSFYLLFIPIPGDVSLDRVVNRMLIVTAKAMGADKVVGLRMHVDSCQPSACFWTFLGVKTAEASGIAVQVSSPPPDPGANDGPEAPAKK